MLDRIILKYRYLKTAVNSFYAFLVHAVYKTAFAPTAFVQEDMIAGKKICMLVPLLFHSENTIMTNIIQQ